MTSAPPRQIQSEIAYPAGDAWHRIGGFADAGHFLSVAIETSSGQGAIGSVRWVGVSIVEVMVGVNNTSYTYVQTQGPIADNLYHGCLALSPNRDAARRLTCTITSA